MNFKIYFFIKLLFLKLLYYIKTGEILILQFFNIVKQIRWKIIIAWYMIYIYYLLSFVFFGQKIKHQYNNNKQATCNMQCTYCTL